MDFPPVTEIIFFSSYLHHPCSAQVPWVFAVTAPMPNTGNNWWRGRDMVKHNTSAFCPPHRCQICQHKPPHLFPRFFLSRTAYLYIFFPLSPSPHHNATQHHPDTHPNAHGCREGNGVMLVGSKTPVCHLPAGTSGMGRLEPAPSEHKTNPTPI